MKWYYADAGQQKGPLEEEALDDLVRQGTVRDDTLVWREGMPTWQPHGSARGVRPPAAPPLPTATGTGYCSECGRPFASDQLSAVGAATLCTNCKPTYMQRIGQPTQAVGGWRYGGFWIRVLARIIDACILMV